MKRIVQTVAIAAVVGLAWPTLAAAQSEPAPPPPEAQRAVPRAERARPPEPPTVREPQGSTSSGDTTGGARRRMPREYSSADAPRGGESTASADASDDDQGARRRGAVRRPPVGDRGGGQMARDRAVPRTSAPRPSPGRVYVYPDYWSYNRFYDPYAYGLGYFAYSPWGWTPSFYGGPFYGGGYGGGYVGQYVPYGDRLGALKLKVDQRDAEVLVDGYYAGVVDDFDGIWQALKLDAGGYRIEIRKPGFETLYFDVRVQQDRTITYRGVMQPQP